MKEIWFLGTPKSVRDTTVRWLSALPESTSLILGNEELHVFQTILESLSPLKRIAGSLKAIKTNLKNSVKNQLLDLETCRKTIEKYVLTSTWCIFLNLRVSSMSHSASIIEKWSWLTWWFWLSWGQLLYRPCPLGITSHAPLPLPLSHRVSFQALFYIDCSQLSH